MRCMPPCASCNLAGVCHREGEPFHIIEEKVSVSRSSSYSPTDRPLLMMPCGCRALPVELVHKLGDAFESFHCDLHGVMKVTKAWKKKAANLTGLGPLVRIPSKYGYTVAVQGRLEE